VNDALLLLIAAELALGVLGGIWFIAAYAKSAWGRTPAGRHMMAVAAVMAVEMGTLLLLMLHIRLPLWVFAVGYGVADAVVVHRLVLLHRARSSPPPG
jgi:hypothetical protein